MVTVRDGRSYFDPRILYQVISLDQKKQVIGLVAAGDSLHSRRCGDADGFNIYASSGNVDQLKVKSNIDITADFSLNWIGEKYGVNLLVSLANSGLLLYFQVSNRINFSIFF